MDRARRVRIAAVIGVLAVVAACGDDDDTSSPSLLDVPETVAIGVLPDPPADGPTLPTPPAPPTTAPVTSTSAPVENTQPIEGPIGEQVRGNRILLVGDSILASAAPRNEGLLCDALVLFGWDAELDAEPGRDIAFADDVLDDRLSEDWDVVALSFGSRVDGTDPAAVALFQLKLDSVIERLSPRPVALFTLAETGDGPAAVNDMIRSRHEIYPNVVVVEFGDAGADGVPVVDDDGVTLTDDGMKRFSIRTAAVIGKAPGTQEGECLPSDYTDDSEAE